MPQYFYSSVYATMATSSQLADNIPTAIQPTTIITQPAVTDPTTSSSNCCCPSTTTFLSTLVDKLYTMAQTLKGQFETYESLAKKQPARGAVFAEIEVADVKLEIKYEYVIYIEKHGPPINGIFDEALLAQIRVEMAASP